MTIRQWVDFSQEIDVNIGADEIALAFQEAWGVVTHAEDGKPKRDDIIRALGKVGLFFNALTDQQISDLNDKQRETVRRFLVKETARWGFGITTLSTKPEIEIRSVCVKDAGQLVPVVIESREGCSNGLAWRLNEPLALLNMFSGAEVGEQVNLEYREMTEDQIEALPEHGGW